MKARFIHHCIHVMDKEKTIAFYEKALGLYVKREKGPEDGSLVNVFMGNDETPFELEFTWNRGFDGTYENAGKDVHIAFRVPDFHVLDRGGMRDSYFVGDRVRVHQQAAGGVLVNADVTARVIDVEAAVHSGLVRLKDQEHPA